MRGLDRREVSVVDVETQTPSPFARTLLFGYVAQFIYEGDSPIAERRAAALVPRPGSARRAARSRRAPRAARPRGARRGRGGAAAADARPAGPRRRGRRRPAPAARSAHRRARSPPVRCPAPTSATASSGSARPAASAEVRMAGEERWAAVEDVGRLRDALGVPVPPGIPDVFTESGRGPARRPGRAVRAHPRPVHRRRPGRPARRSARPWSGTPCSGWPPRAGCSTASSGPPAPGPSGATPRCCAGCAAVRWPGCARRSSRSSRRRWPASSRPGSRWRTPRVVTGRPDDAGCVVSTACSPRSTSSPAPRCRPRRSSRWCSPPGCATTSPPTSTS